MIGTYRVLSIAALLALIPLTGAAAQERSTAAVGQEMPPVQELAAEPVQLAQAGDEAADRAAIRSFLGREDVRRVAGMGGLDMDEAMAGALAMEGERLSDAARQARAIEERLGAQDVITLSATTIIIILLLLIIIIIAA